MKDLAPEIQRQRLLIEGFYSVDIDQKLIEQFFLELTYDLNLKIYGSPIIHSPEGIGKEENQGYDAFIPLIDSGISLYVWTKINFISIIIYTCKQFSNDEALHKTLFFFQMSKYEYKSF